MTDNPTAEVKRLAEEERAKLNEEINHHALLVEGMEKCLGEYQKTLATLRRELARVDRIIEPLVGIEAEEWTETEKAQPLFRPEQHKTRRDTATLETLVLEAVTENPGRGESPSDYAKLIRAKTGRRILPSTVDARLQALRVAGEIEWRDGWYPVSALPPADSEPEASGMSVLMDPDVPTIWNDQDAARFDADPERFDTTSVTLIQDGETCQRDAETIRQLNAQEAAQEAHTDVSVDTPEIPPTDDTWTGEGPYTGPVGALVTPSPPPEVTLDFIRRAGPPGLSTHQLSKHLQNLADLERHGAITRSETGRYRYVDSGDTGEAAK